MIGRLKDKPYSERLKFLKLPSLEHRRQRGDMIEVYKYLSGLNKTDRLMLKPRNGRDTRGHSRKLAKERSSKEVRRGSFSQSVVTVWNELPEHVVTAPTVNRHWEGHPSIYDLVCYK